MHFRFTWYSSSSVPGLGSLRSSAGLSSLANLQSILVPHDIRKFAALAAAFGNMSWVDIRLVGHGVTNKLHMTCQSCDNKPEECSLCFNDYDDKQLRPRTLPCGHTFCSQCIDNAIKNGQLTCPSCHAQHAATAAIQFPISYAVEALVRKLKNIQLTTEEVVPAKPYEGLASGISKKLRSLVQEQKNIINSLITSCEEVLAQLREYQGQLGDWKTHHLQLQDRLYGLVEQNKLALKLLELEDTSVVDMTTQGEEGKTQLQAMLGTLDTVNTAQEVFMTINEVDQCNMEVENWLQKCQELFPDVKTVHTSVKVQEIIREVLEMMTMETGATADPLHLGDSASSIMNKVQEITREIPHKQFTDNKPEECLLCFNDYDDNQLRPRTLPCGHTFCSQCIDNAIKNGQLTCPSCHAQHAATVATQFPISYAVEALVRKLKNIQQTTEEVVPAKPYEGPARGISKKLRSLVQEQKNIINCLITSCEEVMAQLKEYEGQLGDWKTHHLQLQDRLYGLVEQDKSAVKLLELKDTSVVDMTTQGEEGKTQLQAMLGTLDTVNTAQEVFMTINEVDQCNMEVENWLQKCQELFPDVKDCRHLSEGTLLKVTLFSPN
ncbi:uncharacterized protein [Procambarus clarkii]|uniref:uncharacterized protein n=1 Tax=Procambarus clarkii TaxID=6728 RepID=UPI0037430E5D